MATTTTAWIAIFRHFRVIFSFFICFFYRDAFAERDSGQHTEERTWRFWMQFWVFVSYAIWTIWTCFFVLFKVQTDLGPELPCKINKQRSYLALETQKTQQRPESPTVILIWHAIKYKIRKLNHRYPLTGDHYRSCSCVCVRYVFWALINSLLSWFCSELFCFVSLLMHPLHFSE